MDFMKVYENWLNSPALSTEEKAELKLSAAMQKRLSPVSSISCPSVPQVCAAPWVLVCTA